MSDKHLSHSKLIGQPLRVSRLRRPDVLGSMGHHEAHHLFQMFERRALLQEKDRP